MTSNTPSTERRDQDESKGMIVMNDLVYKLEPDMSVAVNKTHKNHYFQQTSYKNTQPAICILNSGADYIDTRQSFLHFSVDLSCVTAPVKTGEVAAYMAEEKKQESRDYIPDVTD